MKKNILIAGASVLVLIGGLVLFIQQGASPTNPEPQTSPEEAASPTPTNQEDAVEEEGEVREVMVESTGLKFDLPEIRVKKGQTVKLTYKNNLGTHDFTLEGFGVATKLLKAGEEETITFVAEKAGTFEFYCSVPGHRQAGMKGAFIVE